jgi:Fe-S oxidoreductase
MDKENVYVPIRTPQFEPPLTGPLRRNTHTYDLLRQCIHCGFCLPTCPTYAVLGVEMDSPRGRIYQMQAVADGKLDISDDFIEHMYCCVGCRACETACPSGVQFGKLIEAAREQIQLETSKDSLQIAPDTSELSRPEQAITSATTEHHNKVAIRLLHTFFFNTLLPSRTVLSTVFGGLKIYQRSGVQKLVHNLGLFSLANNLPTPFKHQLTLPEELMKGAKGPIITVPLPEVTPAIGRQRYRVGFISGCIMDQVFRDINEATIRVLTINGCEVITPLQQNCCGALHIHGGEAEEGRSLARHNIDTFERYDLDAIIINSAGCGSTLKEYSHLLRDDPNYAERAKIFSNKVKDISEFLDTIDLNTRMAQQPQKVAYHDACHLLHGQKIKQAPRRLLQSIPGLTMVTLTEADWCCGSAGIYNLTNQEMGQELLSRKMHNIEATHADTIATGNPGCIMQIAMGVRQRGLSMRVVHPVQLLDEAYEAGGAYTRIVRKDTVTRRISINALSLGTGISIAILTARWLLHKRHQH